MVAETTLQPAGFAPPQHLHREIAEVLYVLSGRLDLQVGDDHRIAVPGTFVGIPSGVAHTMSVAGEEPVKMLMILSNPARALQMIDTLEQAFADGEPTPRRRSAARPDRHGAARHGRLLARCPGLVRPEGG